MAIGIRSLLCFVAAVALVLGLVSSPASANVPAAVPAAAPAASDQTFVGVTPSRLLDTRDGTGSRRGPVGPNSSIDVQVTGRGGVPSSGVAAVVINTTVTQPTASGYVTVWPTGSKRPLASNLNFTRGQTVPNLVVVKVGAGGKVSLFNSRGSTHLLADISGYYTTGAQMRPVTPVRLLDTRDGTGGITGPTSRTQDVQVAGKAGVPRTEATAVLLNVTVTQPRRDGYLTVWPKGASRPNASNLNFTAGKTVPNLVIAKIGQEGKISYYSSSSTHVIMDVLGYVQTPVMLTEALDRVASSGVWSERAVPVQGETRFNSITNYSPSVGTRPYWIEYNLGRQWGTLATTLSYHDDESRADSKLRFRILGDGVPLIDRQLAFGQAEDVTVDVSGVLRVRFEVTGVDRGSDPVFADPRLMVAKGAPFPSEQDYSALLPARVLDTRYGDGAAKAAVQPRGSVALKVLGEGGVPVSGVGSVVMNVTVTRPTSSGYITVWPSGSTRPVASNLNFIAGLTVPNLVIVPVGPDGFVNLYNGSSGSTELIADVLGYFPGPVSTKPTAVLMTEALDGVASSGVWSERAVPVQGETRFNSITNYSPSVGTRPYWIEYNLGRQWGTLATTLSYHDDESRADSQLRFRILGDGVPLVDRTLRFGEAAEIRTSVAGVLRLRLEVTGVPSGSDPVFADPRLFS